MSPRSCSREVRTSSGGSHPQQVPAPRSSRIAQGRLATSYSSKWDISPPFRSRVDQTREQARLDPGGRPGMLPWARDAPLHAPPDEANALTVRPTPPHVPANVESPLQRPHPSRGATSRSQQNRGPRTSISLGLCVVVGRASASPVRHTSRLGLRRNGYSSPGLHAAASSRQASIGMRIVNVLPSVGALRTLSVPPCARTRP